MRNSLPKLETLKKAVASGKCYLAKDVCEQSASVAGIEFKEVKAYFCGTKCVGDMNRVTYSRVKLKRVRNETRTLQYFIPDEGADVAAIERELKRGLVFFDSKDGMLFGAKVDLWKLGKFAEVAV